MAITVDTFPRPPEPNPKLVVEDWEGYKLRLSELHGVIQVQVIRPATPNAREIGLVFDLSYEDAKRVQEVLAHLLAVQAEVSLAPA